MTAEREDSYYGEVEAHFVERRGSPLFITPAEWQIVAEWDELGIPLHVVKDGIDRVFERPKASVRTSRPRKLGYCRQTVAAAYRRFRELTLGEQRHPAASADGAPETEAFDVARHLSRLAEAVAGAEQIAHAAPELAERVRCLVESGRSPDAIEDELVEIDRELIDTVEAAMDGEIRESLRERARISLASYEDRMPEKVYQSALRSAYRRRIREWAELPRLTLFDR